MRLLHENFPPTTSPACLCSFQRLHLHLCPLLIFHALPFTYEEVDRNTSGERFSSGWDDGCGCGPCVFGLRAGRCPRASGGTQG